MDSIQSVLPYALSAVVAAGTAYFFINKKKPVLDAKNYKNFQLIEKIVISHNTALYRFGLPRKDSVLGLPIGQHISVMAEINGKQISRSYTPTSSDEDRGHFDLLIKSYPTGNISKLFAELKLGDSIAVRGPKGNFTYTPNMVRAFGMIAGGTGITPMLQIIRAICRNPEDKTKVNLIFANVNEEDILLKKDLDELAAKHDNFSVYYVLNNPPEGWKGGVGFVTADMIREHCPAPASDVKLLLCGPPPMLSAMSKAATDLGFDKPRAVSKLEDQVFKF
ncbi:NADH-cytochrome b5 reductase [Apophysomyces ossiformis]|uniref:NADH-cytochrome b5 reductase n=1 Tax=Apophysomyces ossiformis TaxID=679940 RepID=A0A8H7EQA0_9FUNG|nr:NADH-cytochrome b5 reductase [Apophysomyces ossiformis]